MTDGQSLLSVASRPEAAKGGTMAQAQIAKEHPARSRIALAISRYRVRRQERRAVRRLLQQRADGRGTGAHV
jgi:hypothetical protein